MHLTDRGVQLLGFIEHVLLLVDSGFDVLGVGVVLSDLVGLIEAVEGVLVFGLVEEVEG